MGGMTMVRRLTVALVVLGVLGTAGCGGGQTGAPVSAQSSARASASPSRFSIDGPLILKTDNSFDAHQLRIKDVRDLDPNQAYVTTPHANLGLDAVLTTNTLDQQQINAIGLNSTRSGPSVFGPLNAPAGYEFLL